MFARWAEKNITWVPPLLILYNFCANLSNDIYLPSMPHLVRLFDTSPSLLQSTMTAWFAGVALPQFLFGPLSDRFGRRPILLMGGICFIIATFACMLATNIETLIIARFFQGVGVCSLNVSSFSIVIDMFKYQERTRILNKVNLFGIISPLIGPVIGGHVMVFFGWRANFLLLLILSLVSVLGLWLKLPESHLVLIQDALKHRVVVRNYYLLLTNKRFLQHLLPYCLLLGALIAYLTAAPFLMIDKLHISAEFFGYSQLPIFGVFILGTIYVHFVNEAEKIKKLLVQGVSIAFAATFILALLSYFFINNYFIIMLPMAAFAFGFSICSSGLVTEVMEATTQTTGYASSLLGFGMAASCMLSSLLVGFIYTGQIFSIAVLLFLLSSAASLIFYFRDRNLPAPATF